MAADSLPQTDGLPQRTASNGMQCGATRLPNTAFGVCMGLGGHAAMWRTAHFATFTQTPLWIVWVLWAAALATLCLFTLLFMIKLTVHPQRVRQEWDDAGRSQFFNAPNLATMLLALGCPPPLESLAMLRAVWVCGAFYQLVLVLVLYHRWMYGAERSMESASTPYLLSVVGWFLLALLGSRAAIDQLTGVALTSFVFGIGSFFATVTYISLFQTFHRGHTAAGAPALFLVIAPLSIASCALAAMSEGDPSHDAGSAAAFGDKTFGGPSQALLGLALFMLCLLIRTGPTITAKPAVFGVYWAYVFPMSALATAAIVNAEDAQTAGSKGLAVALVALAALTIVMVFCRMSYHHLEVITGQAVWREPLDTPTPRATSHVSFGDSPPAAAAAAAAAAVAAGGRRQIPPLDISPARERP